MMAQNNVVYNLVGNNSSAESVNLSNKAPAGHSNPKKAATTFEKALPRPEPRSFSIPALTRIGSRKLEGEKNAFFWKPYTIRIPFLSILIIVSASLVVFIELLLQKNKKDGAITFAEANGELSTTQVFVSQYAATIIAVIYSILIGLVDFDAKRLEPYFQLSKPNGALGKNSLCLQYPVEFLAFVPFSALKRRHWSIFCIGLATVFTFWAITPLQSSLFSNSVVERETWYPGNVRSGILPAKIDYPMFLFNTFSQSWLGSDPNAFTTKEYAVLPFDIPDSKSYSVEDTWDGISTVYFSDVDCEPAQRKDYASREDSPVGNTNTPVATRVWTSPQRNCSIGHLGVGHITSAGNENATFPLLYSAWIGYTSRTETTYLLQHPKICNLTEEEANIFLFFFSKRKNINDTDGAITANYCTTRYLSQKARVSVSAQQPHSVKNVELLGSPQRLSYNEFNSTFFEGIINSFNGDSSLLWGPFSNAPKEFTHTAEIRKQIDQFSESPTLQYVVAGVKNITKLLDQGEQIKAIRRAHRHLFANYVSAHLLSNVTSPLSVRQKVKVEGVVMVPTIGRILEAFLGVVTVLLIALVFLENKRELNLLSDPASITHTMSLISESHDLLEDFESLDRASSEEIEKTLSDVHYKIGQGKDGKYRLDRTGNAQVTRYQPSRVLGDEFLVHGKELSLPIGILFISLLVAVIILLSIIYWSNAKHQGLPTFSKNSFVVQIIYSFVPTAFATGLEPFWILLCRRFAIIQPFTNLFKRHAPPSSSISLKFTAVPPQLVAFSALRTKHFFLGAVALMSLIANILAVSLGGLFNLDSSTLVPEEVPLAQNLSRSISSIFQPQNFFDHDFYNAHKDAIINIPINDHHYIAWANATNGIPLPSWVTKEYFFLPFSTQELQTNTTILEGSTIGFGVKANCKPMPNPKFTMDTLDENSVVPRPQFDYTVTDAATSQKCTASFLEEQECRDCGPNNSPLFANITRMVSREVYPLFNGTDKAKQFNNCLRYFGGSWLHSRWNDTSSASMRNMKTVICDPQFVSGNFDVKIDSKQRIVSYSLRGELRTNDDSQFENGFRPVDLLASYTALVQENDWQSEMRYKRLNRGTHITPTPTNWISQWLSLYLNSTDFINPEANLPSADKLTTAMTKTYESLFPFVVGQSYQKMFRETNERRFTGTRIVTETRMRMSTLMFILSITILAVYFLVACYIYAFRCDPFLPRYPNSLASIVAFLYGSKALEDVVGTELLSTRQRNEVLERQKHTYGYGTFKGRDGAIRIGVEREPLLGLIHMHQNIKVSRDRWWKFW